VADHILNGEITLVINTPLGRESFFDDRTVRRVAMTHGVPCITTLTGASAAVAAIKAMRDESLDVRALQEYHARPARAVACGLPRLSGRRPTTEVRAACPERRGRICRTIPASASR